MLKRLYKLFKPRKPGEPAILSEGDHDIAQSDISHNALRVINQLRGAGFDAYLVGGGVRDLLLGGHPKDFDIATDATPEQTRKIFRNARIIGRRFRIVHVRFGREIIEVTTYRGQHSKKTSADSAQSEKGILLRDNVYGDIRSDAVRRDFTVNALYYSPESDEVIDYTSGLEDLDARQIRIIGDPNARYKEDPVRMLRAVRFASKLGFGMTAETEAPIHEHADYLADVPPARRFEEVLKLFISGYATAVLTKLQEFGLLTYLFPGAAEYLQQGSTYYENFVFAMTSNTDKRLRNDKRVTPAFVYAAMLWPPLHAKMGELINEQKMSPHDALQQAAHGVISQQLAYTAIPKRFLIPMREIWSLQLRLTRRDRQRALQMLEQPRFRAAYDFLLLREEAGEQLDGLGLWWTRFQDANDSERDDMLKKTGSSRRRRPRRKQKTKPGHTEDQPSQ